MNKYLLISALACGIGAGCAPSTPSVAQTTSAPATQNAGFDAAINSFRNEEGLGPLRPHATLNKAARAHAADMVKRGYFSHNSPGGPNGDTFGDRARTAGCALRKGAENIAAGQRSEAVVLEAWKNSPSHRRNMLVRAYTHYGLGRVDNTWVLVLSGGC